MSKSTARRQNSATQRTGQQYVWERALSQSGVQTAVIAIVALGASAAAYQFTATIPPGSPLHEVSSSASRASNAKTQQFILEKLDTKHAAAATNPAPKPAAALEAAPQSLPPVEAVSIVTTLVTTNDTAPGIPALEPEKIAGPMPLPMPLFEPVAFISTKPDADDVPTPAVTPSKGKTVDLLAPIIVLASLDKAIPKPAASAAREEPSKPNSPVTKPDGSKSFSASLKSEQDRSDRIAARRQAEARAEAKAAESLAEQRTQEKLEEKRRLAAAAQRRAKEKEAEETSKPAAKPAKPQREEVRETPSKRVRLAAAYIPPQHLLPRAASGSSNAIDQIRHRAACREAAASLPNNWAGRIIRKGRNPSCY